MNSLEDQLAEALARQGASVAPATVPFDDVVVRAHRRVRRRRAAGALGVAAAVLAGGVVWSAFRPDDGQVTVVDDPTITTEDSSSPPAAAGSWTVLPDAPLSARHTPSVVWTGSEFIVWGGSDASGFVLSDGAAYDPAAGTWRPITPNSWGHPGAQAVWDGEEMIVAAKAGGAAYDPVTDSWRELPTLDLTDGVGISEVVMAGDDVVAVGFGSDVAPGTRLWRLGESNWEFFGSAERVGNLNWKAIGMADGVAMWNPLDGATVLFQTGTDWSAFQAPELPARATLSGDVELVWAGGAVRAVLPLLMDDGDRNATMIATLDGTAWTDPGPTIDTMFALTQTSPFGDDAVVLGGRFDGGKDPLLLDGETGAVQFLADYPLDTTIDQGVAASDDQLFVWGGQTPSDGEQSTDSSPVSATGALWTRAAPAATPTTLGTSSASPPLTGGSVPGGMGSGIATVSTGNGAELPLGDLDPQTASWPDRFMEFPELGPIQSGELSTDGRFVVLSTTGLVTILRPDGIVDDQVAVPPTPGWTPVAASLGPLDVVYLREAPDDPASTESRFAAVPLEGSKRGTRAAMFTTTEACNEYWCGYVVMQSAGVSLADLGVTVPDDFDAVTWPSPRPLVPTIGRADGPDAVMQVTVSDPDGSNRRQWNVRIPSTTLDESSSAGEWHPQIDSSWVGIASTSDGRHFLVELLTDRSAYGRVLQPTAADVYAAYRDQSGTTLLTFRDGAVHLDTYDG